LSLIPAKHVTPVCGLRTDGREEISNPTKIELGRLVYVS